MLDTDTCSYVMKRSHDALLKRLRAVPPAEVCISVVTKAELRYGVEVSPRQTQDASALAAFLTSSVMLAPAAAGRPSSSAVSIPTVALPGALPIGGMPVARQAPSGSGAAVPGEMRVVIDGAVTPEHISDEQASRLVLITLARAPTWDERALRGRLGALRLQAADLAVLMQELTRLRELLLGFQQDAQAARAIEPRTPASTSQVQDALRNIDLAVIETHQRLQELLSADGRSLYQAYLDGEKRKMRALGFTPPPATSGQ